MIASRTFFSAAALNLALFGVVLGAAPGCSSKTNPTPQVALFSQLGTSTAHQQAQCQLGAMSDWITVGKLGPNRLQTDPTQPVKDGDEWPAGTGIAIHITACSVVPSGDGFDVDVSVTQEGKGSFTTNGHFTTQPPLKGIEGIFTRGDTGSFKDPNCTVTFPRPEMGVKSGAVWGQIDCPNVVKSDSSDRVCAAAAEFRFENCDQGNN